MPCAVKCPRCGTPLELPVLIREEAGKPCGHCAFCDLKFIFDARNADPRETSRSYEYGKTFRPLGYQILGVLSPGGMGFLYTAVQEKTRRLAVIKVLPPDLALYPSLVERFRREAIIMKALRHPAIMPTLENSLEGAPYYFTMPFLAGRTLRSLLDRKAKLSLDETLAVFAPLAEALEYMHEAGYLHRDVKPANIFLLTTGDINLFDFGIAGERKPRKQITENGMALGTPAYNAPELFERAETSSRSDQYSLAVVLYEMLTGYLPMGVFLPPAEYCRNLPAESQEAIMKALNHHPEQRFDSVRLFSKAVMRPLLNFTPQVGSWKEVIAQAATLDDREARQGEDSSESNHTSSESMVPQKQYRATGIARLLDSFSFSSDVKKPSDKRD